MNIAAHPIAPEEIMELLDAELPAERAPVVAAHLEECISCGSIAKTLLGSSEVLAHWIVPKAPSQAQFEAGLFETARRASGERATQYASQTRAFVRRHWVVACVSAVSVLWLVSRFSVDHMYAPSLEWGRMTESTSAPGNKTKTVRDIHPPSASVTLGQNASAVTDGVLSGKIGGLSRSEESSEGFSYTSTPGLAKERPTPAAKPLAPPPTAPMIARTVSLAIVAKDFGSVRAGLDAILARHHGYAASLTANTQQNSARSLQASLRIPANELAATVGELKALGQVQSESQSGEEVTQQHADLVARLKNSRETERRLQAILENRTGKISDVLEVEQEIARVRGRNRADGSGATGAGTPSQLCDGRSDAGGGVQGANRPGIAIDFYADS